MNWFKNLSIRYKIVVIIVSVTILSSSFPLFYYQYYIIKNQRENLIRSLNTEAKILSENCTSFLIFNDRAGAFNFLYHLRLLDNVEALAVYDQNNEVFAHYKIELINKDLIVSDEKIQHIHNAILYKEPILNQGQKIGTIVIKANTIILQENIRSIAWLSIYSLLGLLIIAFILAGLFQKLISKPLIKLANTAKKVSDTQNYSIRIKRETKDEVGYLFDSFNNMLEQVERRDNERSEQEYILKISKEKAEQADKLKTAFLANMSHEIRTPMNSIIGFTSLLSIDDISLDERKLYIQLIQSSGDTLLHLIDDIIDISRIEADQISLQYTLFNLHDFLEELYLKYSRELSMSEKRTLIDFKYLNKTPSNEIEIYTDLNRLKQIISNLVNNSIKFTDKGFIEFGTELKNNNYLFYIKDSGIGLPPDKSEEIFNRFMKLENSDKLYRGAGLGLTISKKLVELLGGKIWYDSVPGKGSCFYFTLPTSTGLTFSNFNTSEHNDAKVINKFDLSGKTILVAEDERSNFMLIEQILKPGKPSIIWAQNGIEAIEKFKNNKIDLVLMDIKMPNIDGLAATKQMKDINNTIPIIAQTAYAMATDKNKILDAGCDDYITKPIKIAELKEKIMKYL